MIAPRQHGSRPDDIAEIASQAGRLLGADPAEAVRLARRVLQAAPAHAEASLLLGAALRRSGEPEAAIEVLTPLARAHPSAWGPQFEAGAASAALGDTATAIAWLTRAVELNPRSSLAWHGLGDQLSIIGDAAGAWAAKARPIAGCLGDPALMAAAGTLFEGRAGEAWAVLGQHFNMHPGDPLAVQLVADAGLAMRRDREVAALLAPRVRDMPKFLPVRYAFAMALQRRHLLAQALAEAETLVSEAPAASQFRCLHAALLVDAGAYDEAIDTFQRVLDGHPDQAEVWSSYGHVLKAVGRQADAVAAYRRRLALAPAVGETYWSLANVKVVPLEATEIAAMTGLLQAPNLGAEHRPPLHFALGKALEDAGSFEASFDHYRMGNALQRAAAPYDARANHDYVQRAIAAFNPAFFAARAGAGDSARDPIFIVGLPRSGSTLVEQMLSSHPAVEGTAELPYLMDIAGDLARATAVEADAYPASLGAVPSSAFASVGQDYLNRARLHRRLDRPLFIDKFPSNFLQLGLIHLILPKARIIDVRRHPMACCLSAFKQLFASGQTYSYDLTDLGHYYADYIALMDHFEAVLPGRVHHVAYERLVQDPETELRRVLAYCGLEFDTACLRFHETNRPVRTASSEQVRRPMYRDGLDHWRSFQPWLGPLEAALGPTLARSDLGAG